MARTEEKVEHAGIRKGDTVYVTDDRKVFGKVLRIHRQGNALWKFDILWQNPSLATVALGRDDGWAYSSEITSGEVFGV